MFSRRSTITLDEYPGLKFEPFHQLKKANNGYEPFIKPINTGKYMFEFFKINGEVYVIKPSGKNDVTKALCTKVKNKLTLESAQGSITGNCAKGIKEEFVRFCEELNKEDLSKEEYFMKLIKK